MLKKTALVLSLITIAIYGTILVGGLVIRVFDNDNLKPGKGYVTDYISPTSPYAVQALYDENNHPIDIVIVKAKSGVIVSSLGKSAFSYEIKETSSTMKFVLRDNEGVEMGIYNFDTDKGSWIK